MRVFSKTKNIELAGQAVLASSFFRRTLGLMGSKGLPRGRALILEPCNSIHTCFMRFPIDAVFVSRTGVVVGFETGLKPWRLSRIYWKARYCIEFSAGSFPSSSVSLGDTIVIE